MTESIETKASRIQLDPARLLLLGGTSNPGSSNTRMIGVKWSPTCREKSS